MSCSPPPPVVPYVLIKTVSLRSLGTAQIRRTEAERQTISQLIPITEAWASDQKPVSKEFANPSKITSQ